MLVNNNCQLEVPVLIFTTDVDYFCRVNNVKLRVIMENSYLYIRWRLKVSVLSPDFTIHQYCGTWATHGIFIVHGLLFEVFHVHPSLRNTKIVKSGTNGDNSDASISPQ